MNQEFETKVLNIDVGVVIATLRERGAVETPEFLSRRYVFDMDIGTDTVEWIRLRQQGDLIPTLTYKFKNKHTVAIGKTIEIEVEVSDFEKTSEILHKLPFKEVYYQENKNHIFTVDDIEFSIATWPLIDPYLEVEAGSVERVHEGLSLVGFLGRDVGDRDIKYLYDARGLDLHSYKELKFPT